MKTILWATLTANGNYAQSDPDNPPKSEALADFAAHARAAGNFIVGRRTFEGMRGNGGSGPFGEIDIVVISRNADAAEVPGIKIARSPRVALDYLRSKGHETALISGGADIHNSFLAENLVDEVIFNVAPVLEGKGLNLVLDTEHYRYKQVQLLDSKLLGGGVVQLRYAIDR
jgi:dihydrofolate reductase